MATAEKMLHRLHGLFCIYKPAGKSMHQIVASIQKKLANELNALPCRPPRQIIKFNEAPEGNSSNTLPTITTVPDLADHTLVVGPRYTKEDFDVRFNDALQKDTSGVTVMSLGVPGWLRNVSLAQHIRVYQLQGELGKATENLRGSGRTAERSTFDHITPAKMDRVITAMQAGHQKHMLMKPRGNPDLPGQSSAEEQNIVSLPQCVKQSLSRPTSASVATLVQPLSSKTNLQSQEAYELAVKGLVRPASNEAGPVIYGFKCINFNPPNFTLEVHSVNETGDYLHQLVHELGLELRSTATCTQLRRVRYGRLLLDHALLHKHWTAEHIADNIRVCREIFARDRTKHEPLIELANRSDLLAAGT